MSATVLLAQSMSPSYSVIQFMPKIMSKPCDSRTTRLVGNMCAPILSSNPRHPEFATISPPGELTLRGEFIVSIGILPLSTHTLDMNERDAPVSKRKTAGIELSLNLPITESGASQASSIET